MATNGETGLSETIRRLNETANLDLTEWFKNQDWLGRSEKNVAALEDQLRDVWNLGRNVVLLWSQLDDSIQILAVPQYRSTSLLHTIPILTTSIRNLFDTC